MKKKKNKSPWRNQMSSFFTKGNGEYVQPTLKIRSSPISTRKTVARSTRKAL